MRYEDWEPMGPGRGWDRPDGWEMHDGWGLGAWILMGLLALLFLALVVVVVLLVVRAARGRSGPFGGGAVASPTSAAQQVLDERFARGEIDEEEYLRRRSVLRGQAAPGG